MSKLVIWVAVVALGVAGWTAYESYDRAARLESLERGVEEVQGSLDGIVARLETLTVSGRPRPAPLTAEGGLVPLDDEEAGAELATRAPATPDERLARLEKTVADQRETIAKLEEENRATDKAADAVRRFMPTSFYRNLDDAAKQMELSERQQADMQDAIDIAKRELDDLYAIENDDGVTWKEVRKPKMTNLGGEAGISIAMPDFGKIQRFKKMRIPGSSETFGEAEKRIKDDAFHEMRNFLNPKQTKKWDKAHKDNLLGPSSGSSFVSMSVGSIEMEEK